VKLSLLSHSTLCALRYSQRLFGKFTNFFEFLLQLAQSLLRELQFNFMRRGLVVQHDLTSWAVKATTWTRDVH